ncbi:MAG: hypothetical protein ACOC9Y_00290 [Chloroflexota bacterium]
MNLGKIAAIGSTGLLGEIVVGELARRAKLTTYQSLDGFISGASSWGDAIIVWASVWEIGEVRRRLREAAPEGANPVLLVVDHRDPHIHLSRLTDVHVERCRTGFVEMFDALDSYLHRGSLMTAQQKAPQNQVA